MNVLYDPMYLSVAACCLQHGGRRKSLMFFGSGPKICRERYEMHVGEDSCLVSLLPGLPVYFRKEA